MRTGSTGSSATGSVIAVTGVALTSLVILLAVAVVNGFKHSIEQKVMSFEAPVSVLPAYDVETGQTAMTMPEDTVLTEFLRTLNLPAVARYQHQAILKTADDFQAIECRAFGSGHNDAFEKSSLRQGHWPHWKENDAAADSIVLSENISNALSIGPGDKILLYFFDGQNIRSRRVWVAGLYNSYFGEYDKTVIYTSPALLRSLFPDSVGAVTSYAIENIPRQDIALTSEGLQRQLVRAYQNGRLENVHTVTDALTSGALFFNWLDLLDTNVIVIFILMGAVGAFTIISSLFILILDHVSTIGLLRALGATRSTVTNIFISTAMRLVLSGLIIGNILALGIIVIQHLWHPIPLDPQMYYLAYVPVKITPWTVITIDIAIGVLSWLILILPARVAANVDPTKTLRYE